MNISSDLVKIREIESRLTADKVVEILTEKKDQLHGKDFNQKAISSAEAFSRHIILC